MEYKDYYEIMGVERDAKQNEIKSAYRKLARKYHPDVSKASDAEERFKEVGEAYEVLKDPEKRTSYDQLGANWKQGEDFQPPPGWQGGNEFNDGRQSAGGSAHFSDFFEDLFGRAGGGFQQNRQQGFQMKGEDHNAKVGVSIEDAFNGAERAITLKMPEIDASGHLVNRNRKLNVKIPKGIKQGQRIRLRGQGAAGTGNAPAGDLYLEIDFNPHTVFSAEGSDIFVDLPVTPWEVALGQKVSIPTLGGVVEMKIPEGSQSGTKIRLKGRGLPGKVAGDQFIVLKIEVPEAKTEAQKELYRKMQQEMSFNPRSKLGV